MKKNTIVLPLLLCSFLAIALCSSGCHHLQVSTTNPDGSTNVVTKLVPDGPVVTSTAQGIVFVGSFIYLDGLGKNVPPHPEARPTFEAARAGVKSLIAAGTFDDAALAAELKRLPISALQGDQGTLIIGEVVTLVDPLDRELISLDKNGYFENWLLPLAQGIVGGLDLALGPEQ